ncbi:MAG: hypothetical protein KDD35_07820, partial [Bdellovibrionales bacterium]|nr:hypothetical protein [Bdellovibrionales bacterium]
MNNRFFLIGFSLFCLVATSHCASPKPVEKSIESERDGSKEQETTTFNLGLEHLEKEHYQAAIIEFDKLLSENPQSEFELVALFNKASALEGLGKCEEAAELYRQIVRITGTKYQHIKAQSLFRLSYCFECLGQTRKQIASLKDAFKRKGNLPEEVGQAELPARLAAAYASLGNLKLAEKYFALAQKGLKASYSEKRNQNIRKNLLARTLFFMGRTQPKWPSSTHQAEAYMGSLKYLQGYLLKSAEMGSPEWSPRSAKNLIEAYEFVWKLLAQAPPFAENPKKDKPAINSGAEDKELALHHQKKWQGRLALKAFENIQTLKNMRFPDANESQEVKGIFLEIDRQEKKLQAFLTELAPNNELTPTAQRKEGLLREGRIQSSPSILEKKS